MKNRLTGGERPLSPRYGYVILVLMCLGIAMPSFGQYQIAGFGKEVIADYLGVELTDQQFGTLNMATFLPGVLLSLVSGLLVDRFGPRRIIVIGTVLAGIGVVGRALWGSYAAILLSMFLMGVSTTFFNSNGAKILGTWFEPARASFLVGIFLAFTNLVMSLSTGMAAVFPTVEAAFTAAAVVAVVVAVLMTLLMRDRPRDPAENAADAGGASVRECLRVCVKSRGLWLAALCMLCMTTAAVGPIQFLPTALQARGLEPGTASLCGMCLTLGSTLGCLLVPAVSRLLWRPKLSMAVMGALAAVATAFSWRVESVPLLAAALFVTGLLTTGISPLVASLPLRMAEIGPRYAGTAGGFVATIQLLGNMVLPTYVVTAIAGEGNYEGMFLCFGALMLFFCVFSVFLPIGGRAVRKADQRARAGN